MGTWLSAAALVTCAVGVRAAPLVRVRVATSGGAALAQRLERRGFDVVEGATTARSLELVGSEHDLGSLAAEGFPLELLETGHPLRSRVPAPTPGFELDTPPDYQDYESLLETLDAIAGMRPDLARVVDITATYGAPPTFEGRHIYGVRVSDNVASDEDEPSVLIVSALHAREINTPLVSLHALSELLTGYGVDPDVTRAVDEFEIWIVPVWNPDGYDYVFSTDNLWRKNRRPVTGDVGVDLNRNYPIGWDNACSGSTNPADETYRGPNAISEAETQTMLSFSEAERFSKVLDVHSFGRIVDFGYTCLANPLSAYQQTQASTLADAAGFEGKSGPPPSEGEHPEYEFATRGAMAFLMEIGAEFQPTFDSATAEAAQIWPGVLAWLQNPSAVTGHARDACTGLPITSAITIGSLEFRNGERNDSGGPFGRFDLWLPPGSYDLTFSAPGYDDTQAHASASETPAEALEVTLSPLLGCGTAGHGGSPGGSDDAGAPAVGASAGDGGDTGAAASGGAGKSAPRAGGGCGCGVVANDARGASSFFVALLALFARRTRVRAKSRVAAKTAI